MNQSNHQEYYVARAAMSRELAERAADPAIAAIHANLAARYEEMAAETTNASDSPTRNVQTS